MKDRGRSNSHPPTSSMKPIASLITFLFLASFGASGLLIPRPGSGSVTGESFRLIQEQYIVVLQPGADLERHLSKARTAFEFEVLHRYNINDGEFVGYAAAGLPETAAAQLADAVDVKYVEQDAEVRIAQEDDPCVRLSGPENAGSWGLTRTVKRTPGLDNLEDYQMRKLDGTGVTAFVIDTGIDTTHPLFQGRATFGFDATGEGEGDLNGHGTHCAGTIGAQKYGLSRNVELVAVKVLDASGGGSFAGVIAGIDYVANHSARRRVANLSLGGNQHQATDDALNAMVRAGVFAAVAAGNEGYYPPIIGDACEVTPAGAEEAFTVASMVTIGDLSWRSRFSNWGKCVDLYAPGESIMSTWLDHGAFSGSGTSMAAPHVAGVATKIWSKHPEMSVGKLKESLLRLAVNDIIQDSTKDLGTPNKMLFADCNSY